LYFTNSINVTERILRRVRGARSDVYLQIHERRATKKLAKIRPPEREAKLWQISSLLLLEVHKAHLRRRASNFSHNFVFAFDDICEVQGKSAA